MKNIIKSLLLLILVLFLLPAGLATGWWSVAERPRSWHQADWSSSGVLPKATDVDGAVIHVMAARTGGLKGALSQHTWLVTKRADENIYTRYDKVGWGVPVRVNGYAADARWYSNDPDIVHTVRGQDASRLIPAIERAVSSYPYGNRGGYRIWPGPNSNSFVAHVLRQVPEIGAVLPSNAVGRDFLPNGEWLFVSETGDDLLVSFEGLLGLAVGRRSGIEFNFLGLVAGIDLTRPAIKLPGFGRIGI